MTLGDYDDQSFFQSARTAKMMMDPPRWLGSRREGWWATGVPRFPLLHCLLLFWFGWDFVLQESSLRMEDPPAYLDCLGRSFFLLLVVRRISSPTCLKLPRWWLCRVDFFKGRMDLNASSFVASSVSALGVPGEITRPPRLLDWYQLVHGEQLCTFLLLLTPVKDDSWLGLCLGWVFLFQAWSIMACLFHCWALAHVIFMLK
ncbi:hypothetical protein GQ457_08G022030 [Hibiscus cannabinus]